MADPIALITNRTDKQIAEELKQKIVEAYQPFLAILDEADKDGFNVQAAVGKNAFGKYHIQQLIIVKQF